MDPVLQDELVQQTVVSNFAICNEFAESPGLQQALLDEMTVWEENGDWHISFRVLAASGPGRDYIHAYISPDPNNDFVLVEYSTTKFVRYLTPAAVEVFRTNINHGAGEHISLNIWMFNNLLHEQISYLDLLNKSRMPGIMPHHLPLLFITVAVEVLQECNVLPELTFDGRFLAEIDAQGYDIATLYESIRA